MLEIFFILCQAFLLKLVSFLFRATVALTNRLNCTCSVCAIIQSASSCKYYVTYVTVEYPFEKYGHQLVPSVERFHCCINLHFDQCEQTYTGVGTRGPRVRAPLVMKIMAARAGSGCECCAHSLCQTLPPAHN